VAKANPHIKDWVGRRVWVVGASAGIGAALARGLAIRGAKLTLSARNQAALDEVAIRCGGDARVLAGDLTDAASTAAMFAAFDSGAEPLPDFGIYLAGDYTPLDAADGEAVLPAVQRMLAINYSAAVEWSIRFGQRLLARQRQADQSGPPPGIALVASVAGYAGLPKALAYSPSKAALIRYAECLHMDFAPHGIGVWAINPGFVATRLTAQNDFKMPAIISAEQAAEDIIAGLAAGRFEIHFPKRFTRFMKLISVLPYALSLPIIRRSKT
jgi:NAD(P)-dependent dehydrogenase (short-subunit alcohol dehydrogenase family)